MQPDEAERLKTQFPGPLSVKSGGAWRTSGRC